MNASTGRQTEFQQVLNNELLSTNMQEQFLVLVRDLILAHEANPATKGTQSASERLATAESPECYFRTLIELRQNRPANDAGTKGHQWDVLLCLMLARIDCRELTLSELSAFIKTRLDLASEPLLPLLDAKMVDCFDNAESASDPHLTLSSETARRMAEFYRARICG